MVYLVFNMNRKRKKTSVEVNKSKKRPKVGSSNKQKHSSSVSNNEDDDPRSPIKRPIKQLVHISHMIDHSTETDDPVFTFIGRRLRWFSKSKSSWIYGRVMKYNASTCKHFVKFEEKKSVNRWLSLLGPKVPRGKLKSILHSFVLSF